jgi:hypothetical protein
MTDPTRTCISRDDALLWLNDRLGQRMTMSLRTTGPDCSFGVLTIVGELDHWSASIEPFGGPTGRSLREQLIGLYVIGGCEFDVSDGEMTCEFAVRDRRSTGRGVPDDNELVIAFADGVELGIQPAATVAAPVAA